MISRHTKHSPQRNLLWKENLRWSWHIIVHCVHILGILDCILQFLHLLSVSERKSCSTLNHNIVKSKSEVLYYDISKCNFYSEKEIDFVLNAGRSATVENSEVTCNFKSNKLSSFTSKSFPLGHKLSIEPWSIKINRPHENLKLENSAKKIKSTFVFWSSEVVTSVKVGGYNSVWPKHNGGRVEIV
jgi:hypothetical protein